MARRNRTSTQLELPLGADPNPRIAAKNLLEQVGYGKAAGIGLGGLATALAAAGQLNQVDPMTGQPESGWQNFSGGAGSLLGGVGGGIVGGLIGGPLAPLTIAAGSWLGSELGGRASRAAAGGVEGLLTPSALDQQISDGRKMNEALRDERMLAIPVGEAEAMAANRAQSDLMNSQLSAQGRLEQQRALLAAALAGSARPIQMESFGNSLAGAAQMMGAFG